MKTLITGSDGFIAKNYIANYNTPSVVECVDIKKQDLSGTVSGLLTRKQGRGMIGVML